MFIVYCVRGGPVCPTSILLFLEQVSLVMLGPFCIWLCLCFSPFISLHLTLTPPITSLALHLSPLCYLSLPLLTLSSSLGSLSYFCPLVYTLSFTPSSVTFIIPLSSVLSSSPSSHSSPCFPISPFSSPFLNFLSTVTITCNSVSSRIRSWLF